MMDNTALGWAARITAMDEIVSRLAEAEDPDDLDTQREIQNNVGLYFSDMTTSEQECIIQAVQTARR